MKKERKPSEIIADFINLMEKSRTEYTASKEAVENYDKNINEWVHKIENAPLAEERSKISTQFHAERKARRHHKNNMQLYENIYRYTMDNLNSGAIKRAKTLLSAQLRTEEYIESPNKELKNKTPIKVD